MYPYQAMNRKGAPKMKLMLSVVAVVLILLSCTESDTESDDLSGGGTLTATVDLPASIGSSGLDVLIADSVYHVVAGQPDLSFRPGTSSPVLSVVKVGGKPVALSIFCPGTPGNSISCSETAVSLVMLKTLLYTAPPKVLPDLVGKVREVAAVGELGAAIESSFEKGTNPLTDPDQLFTDAFSVALKAVSGMVVTLAQSQGGK
jgi:hypothetical protein